MYRKKYILLLNMTPLIFTQDDLQDLKKMIYVLECQLRKSETVKKDFETSTGKLLQFVEVMHIHFQLSLTNCTMNSHPLFLTKGFTIQIAHVGWLRMLNQLYLHFIC